MPAGAAGPDDHSPVDGSKTSTSVTASPSGERPPTIQIRPSCAAVAISRRASGASGSSVQAAATAPESPGAPTDSPGDAIAPDDGGFAEEGGAGSGLAG